MNERPIKETLLLLEDDPLTRREIQQAFGAEGYRVIATDLAAHAWDLFTAERPGLAILDITVPDGSGMDVCRNIRGHDKLSFTPVIILTGKEGYDSKVEGFEAGADQYLTKPVPPRELLLWVRALLRRVDLGSAPIGLLQAGDLEIDVEAHLVRFKGAMIASLTVKEFELLCFLVKNRPKVLSRKHILSNLWHTIAVDHVVNTHIGNLKKKVPAELADKIQAIPGRGYRFLE